LLALLRNEVFWSFWGSEWGTLEGASWRKVSHMVFCSSANVPALPRSESDRLRTATFRES
jgi:hypothetical protein